MRLTTRRLARQLGLPRKFYHLTVHELTGEQVEKIRAALGDGNDWPKHTDDPAVNYAVDCLVSYEDKPQPFTEVEEMYREEISAFAAAKASK